MYHAQVPLEHSLGEEVVGRLMERTLREFSRPRAPT